MRIADLGCSAGGRWRSDKPWRTNRPSIGAYAGVRELIIDNVNGSIEVTASTGGSVEVDIEKTLRGASQDRMTYRARESFRWR